MDSMDFRTGIRPDKGLDLSNFIHSQDLQDTLNVGTANKQAEIDALLERARLADAGATQREQEGRASVESIADANRELQRDIHTKDWVTKEQINAINESQGTNHPAVDMPMSAFVSLQATDRAAKTQQAIADRQAATQGMIADRQEAGMNFRAGLAADAESRRWAHEDRRAGETKTQQDLAQQRLDDAEAARVRTGAQGSALSQIQGALNTRTNKQGLPTAFDPGQALVDNPGAVAELGQQVNQAGGLPKGAPVTPIKPFSSYESAPWFGAVRPGATADYQKRESDFNAGAEQWKQNIAPPTTAGGSALTKGKVPSEFGPSAPAPNAPASSDRLGGMGLIPSSPSSSAPATPTNDADYVAGTYKGRPAKVNPKTGHVIYTDSTSIIPGVM